jgi:formylglycine-generating enzyme required for sulfatase activity
MDLDRNIVPVLVDDFRFGDYRQHFTGKLKELPRHNALTVPHDYFDAAMEKLRTRFLRRPIVVNIQPTPLNEQPVIERKIEEVSQMPTPTTTPTQSFEPELILIPAGEFLMGSDPKKDKAARDDEQSQHTLYLPDYYIAKTPVTQAQYAAFVQATGHDAPFVDENWAKAYNWQGQTPPKEKADHPVVLVNWHDAVAYCRWLTETTGRTYRLPTEAEWEKAARGPDGRIYPWGNQWDKSRCNTAEGGKGGATPVGTYPQGASPYGVLDMAGNVLEWCATKWRKSYPYDVKEDEWTVDYLDGTNVRVLRGGSWRYNQDLARCASRLMLIPVNGGSFRGCRVACSPI